RDYMVPSRVHQGKAYSLPQSPQLYKQILMVSGCDRYFQLAKCMRDEDLRADRQPEFTQIDLEMSFVEQKDVIEIVNGLTKHVMKKSIGLDVKTPFEILTYEESMARFGCDKPDMRFGLELSNITKIVKDSEFSVFSDTIKSGGIVKCINPETDLSRKEIDELTEIAKKNGAKGLAWTKIADGNLDSGIAKFLSDNEQKNIIESTNSKKGTLLFIADKETTVNKSLSLIRNELGKKLKLIDESEFKFCWIVDYPLFEWDEDENRWAPAHHMFTMPKKECLEYLETDPGKVKATLYDFVLNGIELGSGSIRIHRPDIQEKVMKVIGLEKEEAYRKFGFLLEAFKYGAPPHGGIALGFDRFVALMCKTNDIREVIAFPKNKAAQSPMDGCPSPMETKSLDELSISVNKK
ncbi:MAG: aspartate--tRNA ligase, partial [Nanoarchaeota archaeon]